MPDNAKPKVLITGAAGEVGKSVATTLHDAYDVIGMDETGKSADVPLISVDLTNDASVARALEQFRTDHGAHIASVIHLAGYFDFSGEDNALYDALNVQGTRRLVQGLQRFHVEQFVFAGTMLVHKPTTPGHYIDEDQPLGPEWIYPQSKADAEAMISKHHGATPYALLHLAGVYTERTLVPTTAHQVTRIFEKDLESHVYAGDLKAGQSMVHQDDMADAFHRTVDHRASLPADTTILIGEADPLGYGDLQDEIGSLIFGHDWTTVRAPAALAAAGAWAQDKAADLLPKAFASRKPFIRPYMMKMASDHYALDIRKAKALLGWEPRHRLSTTLPAIIAALKADPAGWYKANGIKPPQSLAASH